MGAGKDCCGSPSTSRASTRSPRPISWNSSISRETQRDWEFFRNTSRQMLWPHIDEEYQQELQGIADGVKAHGVDLDVYPGEVVALVGDNGAGKSTLVKTISGAIPADEGEFMVEGRRVGLETPHAAAALGIATVYQDLALCENLDVISNLFLGAELGAGPFPGVLRRLREELQGLLD